MVLAAPSHNCQLSDDIVPRHLVVHRNQKNFIQAPFITCLGDAGTRDFQSDLTPDALASASQRAANVAAVTDGRKLDGMKHA